jgi:UDP-GlcNAc:undecaprenyl-phosphate GlcNAc-1-phosphate transferase
MFGAALFLSLALTPVAARLAVRAGCVDRPGGRKIHARNIPYFGGLAVFLSFISVLLVVYRLMPAPEAAVGRIIPVFLLGGTVVLVTGLIDDFRPTRPLFKLAGQVIAGSIPAVLGIRIEFLTNPLGGDLYFGPLTGGILTVIWVVSVINAINLIDGLDGLASGVTLISAISLFAVAGYRMDTVGMMVTVILAGACLGFLRYNFFPARIFLGDAGSMFLGFTLAVVGIQGLQKGATVTALMIPLAALGVPVLDTIMAVIRRSKVKANIFAADGEHLHHRLVRLGIREKNVVLLVYFFSVHLGMTAFVLTLIPPESSLMILILIAMGIILWIKTLAFIEDKMAVRLRESEQEAMIDEATGLCRFRYLSRRVLEEMNSCDRYPDRSFSLLVFEMKGLEAFIASASDDGQRKLRFKGFSSYFKENVRTTDVVSYMGGESFVIMTPEEGEGRQYLIERLTTIFENIKGDLGSEAIELTIRVVDYPGHRGIVQELLQGAVEVA